MVSSGESGLQRIISAFGYSFQGLRSCWRKETAFRQEVIASIFLIPLGLYFGQGGVEKALLIATCIFVMTIEVLNSSIEAVVDRVGNEYHELSGLAKDLGSAAVLLSLVIFVVIWCLVLFF